MLTSISLAAMVLAASPNIFMRSRAQDSPVPGGPERGQTQASWSIWWHVGRRSLSLVDRCIGRLEWSSWRARTMKSQLRRGASRYLSLDRLTVLPPMAQSLQVHRRVWPRLGLAQASPSQYPRSRSRASPVGWQTIARVLVVVLPLLRYARLPR